MTTTTTADLVASAQQLQPLLREHLPSAGDEAGELAGEVVDALHEHGLFGMWVPEPLGGSELDPLSSLRVIQTLAEADPSTAWVVMAAALATGTGGAYLADEAVAEMFGGERFPVVAGQGTRPGTAKRDGDGYRLSGSWSFASGIKHAQWIHTLGNRRGDRATADLRAAGRAGDAGGQLGRPRPAGDRQHRLQHRGRLRPGRLHPPGPRREGRARRHAVPPRDHALRPDLPLRVGARRVPADARRAGRVGPGQGRPAGHDGRQQARSTPSTARPRPSGTPPGHSSTRPGATWATRSPVAARSATSSAR